MKKRKEIINMMGGDQPVFLHFYTTGCIRHKDNISSLRQVQKSNTKDFIQLVNIDIQKQPRLIEELDIEGLPIVVLYHSGKEVWRQAGKVPEAVLQSALSKINEY